MISSAPHSQQTFYLKNNLANLVEARLRVKSFFSSLFSPSEILQVVQSVDEALSNIIEHGGKQDNEIKIEMKIFDKQIHIVITDYGISFNPLKYPEVKPEHNYDAGIDGGMGIYIFRNFMNASYRPLHPQGNELTLIKEISK